MRRLLPTLVMTLLAAPIWAPSLAYAAKPNVLSAPVVTPLIGTPQTTFTYSVHYAGTAASPATTVRAEVAGLSVTLALVSGTAVDGQWAGRSQLPVGSWLVHFVAILAKGSIVKLHGPMLTVLGPTPMPSLSLPAPGTDASRTPTSTPMPAPVVTGRTTPKPSAATTTAAPSAAASGRPVPRSTPSPAEAKDVPAPAPSRPSSVSGRSPRAAPSQASATAGTPSASAAPASVLDPVWLGDPWHMLPTAIAVAGAAALTLVALLIVLRRRRADEAAESSGPGADRSAVTVEPELIARARAAARTRVAPADDPILRAMGLDAEAPAARGAPALRARARRLSRGPVEPPRPADPPSATHRR